MDDEPDAPIVLALPRYPLLLLVARRSGVLAAIVALLLAGGGVALAVVRGAPGWAAAGIAAALVCAFLLRLLGEVARLLVDTLIPQ